MVGQILIQMIIISSNLYETKAKRNLEYFNETILAFVMYTIFIYSPWVPDAELTFNIGYITIAIVSLHLFVNLTMIFTESYRQTSKRAKIHFAMKKNDATRKKLKVKIETAKAKRLTRRQKLIKELKYKEWNEPFPSSELESSSDDSDSSNEEESPVALPVTKPRRDHRNKKDKIRYDSNFEVVQKQESQVVAGVIGVDKVDLDEVEKALNHRPKKLQKLLKKSDKLIQLEKEDEKPASMNEQTEQLDISADPAEAEEVDSM